MPALTFGVKRKEKRKKRKKKRNRGGAGRGAAEAFRAALPRGPDARSIPGRSRGPDAV